MILGGGPAEISPAKVTHLRRGHGGLTLDGDEDLVLKRSSGTKLHHIKTSNNIFDGTNVSDYIKILEFEMRLYDLDDQEKI